MMKIGPFIVGVVLSVTVFAGCDHGDSKTDAPIPAPSGPSPTPRLNADATACFDKKLEARTQAGSTSALDLVRLYGVCAPNATSADFAAHMEKYDLTFANGIHAIGAKKKP